MLVRLAMAQAQALVVLDPDPRPEVFRGKTLDLMHANRMAPRVLPWEITGEPTPGFGFGLGSRVMLDVAASQGPGSVGEFGWAGAAKTYYWVDPAEDLVGVFMTQYLTAPEQPERTFRSVVYQAIDD